MPTKTFLNLTESKKAKIEKAALKEFSMYTYDQISINRIIQSINMPRGSFYLYFKDKEDLYLYMGSKYHNIVLKFLKDEFNNNNNDIIDTYKSLFENAITYCSVGKESNLFKNFLIGLNHNIENKISEDIKNLTNRELMSQFLNQVSEVLNYSQEKTKALIELLNSILIRSLAAYYILNLDIDSIRNVFYSQLDIIFKGIKN